MSMFSITSASVDAAAGGGLLERVEVHAHEVDELDLVLLGGDHVRRVVAAGEQAGVELRVQRLDAPVHDLREAREVVDRADLEPGRLERPARCRRWRRARRRARRGPCAKSTMPVLSDTESSARRIATSPGCVIGARTIDQRRDRARGAGWRGRCGRRRGRSAAPPRTAARARSGAARRGPPRPRCAVRQVDRALEDDRPGVDALVDEVDGDAEDLDAVGERLLDRADARERRQQRGMDVDDALGEAAEEVRRRAAACSRRGRRARRPARPSHSAIAASRARAVRERVAGEHRGRARRPPARARAPARPACRSRPRRPRRPRGRGRGRGSPAGSCPRPRRGRRPSRDFELREPPAGRAQRARLQQRVDALEHRVGAQVAVGAVAAAARRSCTCAITFERPPRRTSTARVRPTPGCGGRDDVEDRVVELVRSPLRAAARAGPGGSAARARRRRRRGRERRVADVAARARRPAGCAAVAEVAQDARRGGSVEPSTHAHTERYWRQRAFVPSRADGAADRERAAVPLAGRRGRDTRSGGDGDGWITPARARWPTIARTASSSPPPVIGAQLLQPDGEAPVDRAAEQPLGDGRRSRPRRPSSAR